MQTQIRFLHAYPPEKAFILSENGAVDILLNDQMIVERLLFGEHTDYISVEPGRGTISVFPSGNREQTLVRNNVIIPEDNRYTLILADRDGAPVLAPVQEREITLADGYSGIRFGHLAVGTEPVRIILVDRYEQSEPVYENVEYGQITEYIVEQEAPIAFDVYTDESDERIVRIPWQQYRAQIPYTIFLLGPTTGDKQLKIVTLSEEKA